MSFRLRDQHFKHLGDLLENHPMQKVKITKNGHYAKKLKRCFPRGKAYRRLIVICRNGG